MVENIWYISKYAVHPRNGKPSRQYFFCKNFARNGRKIKLISSRSAGLSDPPQFFLQNSIETLEEENFSHVILNGLKIKLGFNLPRIWSWMTFEIRLLFWALTTKSTKPDVIIVSSLSVLSFFTGTILKRYFDCILICEVRDIWPLTLIETNNINPKNLLIKFLSYAEKTGYKNAAAIIGTMPNLKEHVANIIPSAVDKVWHIPMGYDDSYFEKTNEIINDPFKNIFEKVVPSKNFTVGYAGSIGKVNCVDQIIESAIILKDKPITFLILGDGPLKEDLKTTVLNSGIKNVVFIGAVKKEFVNQFLKRCNLLLSPIKDSKTLYTYGVSPNKWIDYMFSGRPILVSFNGYKSIINEACCGEFIEADNPFVLARSIEKFSLMESYELDEMGAKGKRFLENYLNYESLSNNYLEIIDGYKEADIFMIKDYYPNQINPNMKAGYKSESKEKILNKQLG